MRFSLQDVKKQIQRKQGDLFVSLHLLRPGELHTEIERLIAYFEQLVGQPQKVYSSDEARACIGDYRLADCLIATLSSWYTWQSPSWAEILQRAGSAAVALMEEQAITSPQLLRLALYDFVNEHYHGFLTAAQRPHALQTFADSYQLSVADLEYLLVLDSDEEALLVRATPQPPDVQQVATRYNQWAFEAALFSSSSVQFVIDCQALELASTTATGVGAVIKRLCYLARLLGVYYDLSYEEGVPPSTSRSQQPGALLLRLIVYGPQEMTGAPQQYGLRLARLCRLLLGYQQRGQRERVLPAHAIVSAEAVVHFLQRTYRFTIDAKVLKLLPSQTDEEPQPQSSGSSVFDSSIEQSFAEAFSALENSHAVDGWALVREPEPLLLEKSIFIPDFALTRAGRRIYVEILGFWTPSYRERKIQKLQQLQERDDIVLAIPREARPAFASIAAQFPIVWYDGQLSATELLQLLRTRYDDLADRLASIDVAAVQQQVEREGWIPERECYALLGCYRRAELALAAERVMSKDVAFEAGIGLFWREWMEHLHRSFVEWIESIGPLPLSAALEESRKRWPRLVQCEDATLEALVSLWPEIHINRSSIFDATIEVRNASSAVDLEIEASATQQREGQPVVSNVGTSVVKKVVRERRAQAKKRQVTEVAQDDLWG